MSEKFFKPEDFEHEYDGRFGEGGETIYWSHAATLANIKIEPILKQLKEAREIIEMHAKHGSPASKEFLERWKE